MRREQGVVTQRDGFQSGQGEGIEGRTGWVVMIAPELVVLPAQKSTPAIGERPAAKPGDQGGQPYLGNARGAAIEVSGAPAWLRNCWAEIAMASNPSLGLRQHVTEPPR
jgi:hypothetical protein